MMPHFVINHVFQSKNRYDISRMDFCSYIIPHVRCRLLNIPILLLYTTLYQFLLYILLYTSFIFVYYFILVFQLRQYDVLKMSRTHMH